MEILICVCIIFTILFIGNIYKFTQQEKEFERNLKIQNKRIIFVNNPTLDIKAECYQPDSFFKMHNNGNNPCEEAKDYEYKHYATIEDYYM